MPQDNGGDPWQRGLGDPWSQWRNAVQKDAAEVASSAPPLAALSVKGKHIFVHGQEEVRQIMAIVKEQITLGLQVSTPTPPGDGWRSQAYEKKNKVERWQARPTI